MRKIQLKVAEDASDINLFGPIFFNKIELH
jgi:hypothetical protein